MSATCRQGARPFAAHEDIDLALLIDATPARVEVEGGGQRGVVAEDDPLDAGLLQVEVPTGDQVDDAAVGPIVGVPWRIAVDRRAPLRVD